MVSAQGEPTCVSIDEHTVLRDFEAIHATLRGDVSRGGKLSDATVVGRRSSAEDSVLASVAGSWSGSRVTQQAADEARREAQELLARWAATAPPLRPQESPPRPRPPPQPSQEEHPRSVAHELTRDTAPRSASPTLSSSSKSDGSDPSAATLAASGKSGPDPVTALESQRQVEATNLAHQRLQAAAEWQQRALWQQRELEQEQQVHANNDRRAAGRQRAREREATERKLKARDLRWARTKARAASALAEDSAARAKREETMWMVKARQATNAVVSARDRRVREQRAAEDAEKERRAQERARREQASRRWEQSRRRAEEAAREHSLRQDKAAQMRERAKSRTSKDEPAAKTIRDSWRPPLPYEAAVSGINRIPSDHRASLRLVEGFEGIGTATSAQAPGSSVAQESLASHRRVGPEVRGIWSRYADQRLDEPSDRSIERIVRTGASAHEHTRPPSPVSGWATSIVKESGADEEVRPHASHTTVPQPVEHTSPPSTTPLPHEHVRSPTQSKPGRGSPYPYFHDSGGDENTIGSSLTAVATQYEADAEMPMPELVSQAPPLGQHPLRMPEPSLAAQQQGIADAAGSGIVTEKLIDLAYKITEGMSFKEPPSTPRRPGLAA